MLAGLPYQSVKGHRDSVAVLDVGSSKIACFIAEPDEHGQLHIIGIGHASAKGLRGATITDSKAAEESIAHAVSMAEKMAGVTLDNVMVSLSLPQMHSHSMHVELNIAGNAVSDQDISDILQEACQSLPLGQRQILHCFVTQYQLDGAKNIRDPRSMYGMLLKADVHIVTVESNALVNLSNTLSRCHLDIAEFISAPYAAGLGCLEHDERELGVTLIDMGATETGIVIFQNGANVYSHVLPIGGHHVTKDIAQGLSTSIAAAERLKTLHGSVLASANDDQHTIHVPRIGEENDMSDDTHIPRLQLTNIIHPRLDEMFDMVQDAIEHARMEQAMGRHIVLTGGACQLVGVREMATEIFGRQVRIGKPKLFPGLAESVSGPHFSTAVGMLYYVQNRPFEDILFAGASGRSSQGVIARFISWIKHNI